MAQQTRRQVNTDSSLGAATAGATTEIATTDGSTLRIYVDDAAGGTPASYSLEVENYDPTLDTWFTQELIGSSTDASASVDSVGPKMRVTLTNESGGPADFRERLIEYE